MELARLAEQYQKEKPGELIKMLQSFSTKTVDATTVKTTKKLELATISFPKTFTLQQNCF